MLDLRRIAPLPVAARPRADRAAAAATSGPQTKEGFISDADGVCQSLAGEFESAGSEQPGTPQEVADANHVLADLYEKLADRLADVRLPDAGAARTEAQAYVASVTKTEPMLARLRSTADGFLAAAKGTDRRRSRSPATPCAAALDAFRAARAQSDSLAVSYGLNLCGNLD